MQNMKLFQSHPAQNGVQNVSANINIVPPRYSQVVTHLHRKQIRFNGINKYNKLIHLLVSTMSTQLQAVMRTYWAIKMVVLAHSNKASFKTISTTITSVQLQNQKNQPLTTKKMITTEPIIAVQITVTDRINLGLHQCKSCLVNFQLQKKRSFYSVWFLVSSKTMSKWGISSSAFLFKILSTSHTFQVVI